jgi:ribonucleoside-triphosphate reductase
MYNEKIPIDKLKADEKIRKRIENEFQQFIHSVNHLSRIDGQSPFSNLSLFDRPKLRTLISKENMGWYFPDIDVETAVEYIMELQDIFLNFFDKGDPMAGGMPYRFPIVTINMSKIKRGNNYDVEDIAFLSNLCSREIYRYNILVSEGSRVASCCRLLSDTDMLSMAGQVNSFGGGGLSLGSHRVVTINLNRIALECDTQDYFFEVLNERLESCAKILRSHKQLIEMQVKAGLQSFISNGWINMRRMFSTVGILGIVEAADTMRRNKLLKKDQDFIADQLIFINKKTQELSKTYELICNIEQIPGESQACRLAQVDRILFGEKNVPAVMYSNQFIPLWGDATIWERLETDGRYNKLITGGGIVHAQIGEKVTAKQAENIIKFAVKSGCEHFALNAVYSQCSKDHTTFGKIETCPVCGEKIKDYLTRVVGFFVKVSNMNKTRREWEFPKRTFIDLKN